LFLFAAQILAAGQRANAATPRAAAPGADSPSRADNQEKLESIFQRPGVELSRKTMCDWMAACAELVSPVWKRMKEVVLMSKAVQTDDTPVPVRDRVTRTRTGRIWTYVGDRNGPYIVYDYTGDRRREGPEEFLQGYGGYLQADAYAGYDAMFKPRQPYLTEVACWAHVRRHVFEAQTSNPCRATVILAYIQLLCAVEREVREAKLNTEQRRELRQAKSLLSKIIGSPSSTHCKERV
jgi:hypothetical protein